MAGVGRPRKTTAVKATTARKTTAAKKTTTRAVKAAAAAAEVPVNRVPAKPRKTATPRARRTTATAAAEPVDGTQTGDGGSDTGDGAVTAVVPFHGRDILVKAPSIEQVALFRRLATKFSNLKNENVSLDVQTAIGYLDRAIKIVTSVMVREVDKEWLEDQILEGVLTLQDLVPLVPAAIAALKDKAAEGGNRATRRRAKLGR